MKVTYHQHPPSRVGERITRIDLEDGEVMKMNRSGRIYCRVDCTLYIKDYWSKGWGRSVIQPWEGSRSVKHIPHIGKIIDYEGNLPTIKH